MKFFLFLLLVESLCFFNSGCIDIDYDTVDAATPENKVLVLNLQTASFNPFLPTGNSGWSFTFLDTFFERSFTYLIPPYNENVFDIPDGTIGYNWDVPGVPEDLHASISVKYLSDNNFLSGPYNYGVWFGNLWERSPDFRNKCRQMGMTADDNATTSQLRTDMKNLNWNDDIWRMWNNYFAYDPIGREVRYGLRYSDNNSKSTRFGVFLVSSPNPILFSSTAGLCNSQSRYLLINVRTVSKVCELLNEMQFDSQPYGTNHEMASFATLLSHEVAHIFTDSSLHHEDYVGNSNEKECCYYTFDYMQDHCDIKLYPKLCNDCWSVIKNHLSWSMF